MTELPVGVHFGVSELEYRNSEGINQSLLKRFGTAKSPKHFKFEETHDEDDATVQLRIGRYVDTSLFVPSRIETDFATWDGDRRGRAWQAFQAANPGKTILAGGETLRAVKSALAVLEHEDAGRIYKACSHQVVVVAEHPISGCRLKGAIDLLPKSTTPESLRDYVFELKTTEDASPDGFARIAALKGYHIQASFYADLLELCGVTTTTFGWICVETNPPHEVVIYYSHRNSEEMLAGRNAYEKHLRAYLECSTSGVWPGYQSWIPIKYKHWQLRDNNL